jgi:hypothetical protein
MRRRQNTLLIGRAYALAALVKTGISWYSLGHEVLSQRIWRKAQSGFQGLALISVLERVKLVKGTLSIIPRLQSGPEGSVRAPLAAGTQANQAKKAAA